MYIEESGRNKTHSLFSSNIYLKGLIRRLKSRPNVRKLLFLSYFFSFGSFSGTKRSCHRPTVYRLRPQVDWPTKSVDPITHRWEDDKNFKCSNVPSRSLSDEEKTTVNPTTSTKVISQKPQRSSTLLYWTKTKWRTVGKIGHDCLGG